MTQIYEENQVLPILKKPLAGRKLLPLKVSSKKQVSIEIDPEIKSRTPSVSRYKKPPELVLLYPGITQYGQFNGQPRFTNRPRRKSKRKKTEITSVSPTSVSLSMQETRFSLRDSRESFRRRSSVHLDESMNSRGSFTRTLAQGRQSNRSDPLLRNRDSINTLDECDSSSSQVTMFTTRGRRYLSEKMQKRRTLGAKFRRLAKFLSILFGLWKTHAKRVNNFLDTNVDLIDYSEPVNLMFDVTYFKADKEGVVSQETKRILMKKPSKRTEEEVKYVQVALRNYHAIAEYPLDMTKAMAQRAWLETYDRKRIIIKQTHPAKCFYFILSGSVIVSRMDSEYSVSRTVCFLNRGEEFGELGLISNAPRGATVISREPVELLVIGDEDYVEIFMAGGLKTDLDPIIRQMWCFQGFPVEKMVDNPSNCVISYFKRNTVLVPDSKVSEWIYIIKSGSCTVLKKLTEVGAFKRSQRREDLRDDPVEAHHKKMEKTESSVKQKALLQSKVVQRKKFKELEIGIECIPLEDKPNLMDSTKFVKAFNTPIAFAKASIGKPTSAAEASSNVAKSLASKGPFLSTIPISSKAEQENKAIPGDPVDVDSAKLLNIPEQQDHVETREELLERLLEKPVTFKEEKRTIMDVLNKNQRNTDSLPEGAKPMFVRVQTLTKGAYFGLGELVHYEQPALSLISNGAECLLIKKKMFLDNASQTLMNKIRDEVSPYPSNVELQAALQLYVNWVHNKEKTMQDALIMKEKLKNNVHDARSSLSPPRPAKHYNIMLAGALNG